MFKKTLFAIILLVSSNAYSQSPAEAGLAYINGLPNQKAACMAKVDSKYPANGASQENLLKRKEELAVCYQKMIVDVAKKFYPDGHFGKNVDQEISQAVSRQRHLYEKMTHCPSSKNNECDFYENYDASSAIVDYLSETLEFMALNVGEGYSDFNPERWLKKWDNAAK